MEARGNSFANGPTNSGASVNNGQPVKPPGQASIWDHLEPGLPR